jgi:competence protein ComEC
MFKPIEDKIRNNKKRALNALALGVIADAILLSGIFSVQAGRAAVYFLPVGQGDSELIVLQGGAKVLVDGGPPDGAVLDSLGAILGPRDRYIDVVVLTHPQLDHYGGLIDVLRRYDVGIFIGNGMATGVAAYGDLLRALKARNVRQAALSSGDSIVAGGEKFAVVWPDAAAVQSGDPNLTALVMEYSGGGMKALFTSDVDSGTEAAFLPALSGTVNILKVAHHGSRYSSSPAFLAATRPQVAVIEVGKNSYGHPAPETLARLADTGALVLRTDEDGLIKISALGNALAVSKLNY